MKLRWYQQECADAMFADIMEHKNGIGVVPTGGGKSVILCEVARKYLEAMPHKDVLIVSHVSEILEQNHEKLSSYFNGMPIGLYSASLGKREKRKITVAGIQSIHRKPELFRNVGLIIPDECHMISNKDQGTYRKLIGELDGAVLSGLTATPYRTGQGYLHKAEDGVFEKLSYDLSSTDNYNRLVDEGYLSILLPVPTESKMDTEGLKITAGDFNDKALSERFDRDGLTEQICEEIAHWGEKSKRKKWLIFAIDRKHAEHITDALKRRGYRGDYVYSGMGKEGKTKAGVLERFRTNEYRFVVNVNMLTTGVDIPDIDFIAMVRPTQSAVIHVQSVGRGGRVVYAPGYDLDTIDGRLEAIKNSVKKYCLVADFAGNTMRLGPVNDVFVKEPGKKKGSGRPMAKSCDNCLTLNHIRAVNCVACGEEFKFEQKIMEQASTAEIVKKSKATPVSGWVDVWSVSYSIHQKPGRPDGLRVTYQCGLNSYSQWVNIDHHGFAGKMAAKWISNRYIGEGDPPGNVQDALKAARAGLFREPKRIYIEVSDKFPEVKKFDWTGETEAV